MEPVHVTVPFGSTISGSSRVPPGPFPVAVPMTVPEASCDSTVSVQVVSGNAETPGTATKKNHASETRPVATAMVRRIPVPPAERTHHKGRLAAPPDTSAIRQEVGA